MSIGQVTMGTKAMLAAGCILLGLLLWKPHAAQESDRPARQQWEYLIVEVLDYDWEAQMNRLGAQGWELIYIRRVVETFGLRLKTLLESGMAPSIKYEYIFKRPR